MIYHPHQNHCIIMSPEAGLGTRGGELLGASIISTSEPSSSELPIMVMSSIMPMSCSRSS